MPLTDEDRAEVAAVVAATLAAQTESGGPTVEQIEAAGEQQVAVIEAQAAAEVAVIEARAEADQEMVETIAEVEATDEPAAAGDGEGEDVADDLDVSDGDALGIPESEHWLFKPIGRKR